jgi:hypothetical protein
LSQVITLDHNSYMKQVDKIRDSHRKSQLVRDLVKLRPRAQVDGAAGTAGKRERLPTYYDVEGAEEGEAEDGAISSTAGRPGAADAQLRLFYPPASAGHNNYTLLKCGPALLKAPLLLLLVLSAKIVCHFSFTDLAVLFAFALAPPVAMSNWCHPCALSPSCRFYKLSSELVHAVLAGLDENSVDFSFRWGFSTS